MEIYCQSIEETLNQTVFYNLGILCIQQLSPENHASTAHNLTDMSDKEGEMEEYLEGDMEEEMEGDIEGNMERYIEGDMERQIEVYMERKFISKV